MIADMKANSLKTGQAARIALAGAIGMACMSCSNGDYEDGVHRAESELSSGSACIYTVSMADRGRTDPTTGLPYLVIETPITPELVKMIDGHNQTIYARHH